MQVISEAAETLPNNLHARVAGYRYQVFVKRLEWPLHTEDGMESDQLDGTDTVNGVARDAHGRVTGCARLLPTTGQNLLREVSPNCLTACYRHVHRKYGNCRALAEGYPTFYGDSVKSAQTNVAVELPKKVIKYIAERGEKQPIAVTTLAIERILLRNRFATQRADPMVNNYYLLFNS